MKSQGVDVGCYNCNNLGYIVVCIDDICHALGYCIHGDGEDPCPVCNGEGEEWYGDEPYPIVDEETNQ